MSLEKKVANWIDLGVMSYQETYSLQEELVKMRKEDAVDDIILAVQHPLEVSFGSDKANNIFSDLLLGQVRKSHGDGFTHDDVVEYLMHRYGAGFSQVLRGGGATVLAPGQFVYYPIVLHSEITGKVLDLASYKTKIYQVMFDSLKNLGVAGLNIGSDNSYASRRERKDIWVQRDGKSLKMGSKGIRISGKVAHHGFVLYAQERGVENFWMVNPCGYKPDEVIVCSVEYFLGRSVGAIEVDSAVRSAIKNKFGYTEINNMSVEELKKKTGIIQEAKIGRT
ncbi:MAG: hypothetical protein Q8Q42_03805 [Nanoarchaeota archaeon]|nr:hypothetical protein [Nanoarchaeota archaeon]